MIVTNAKIQNAKRYINRIKSREVDQSSSIGLNLSIALFERFYDSWNFAYKRWSNNMRQGGTEVVIFTQLPDGVTEPETLSMLYLDVECDFLDTSDIQNGFTYFVDILNNMELDHYRSKNSKGDYI
jgi:hypothetical protein